MNRGVEVFCVRMVGVQVKVVVSLRAKEDV
jgi:hypothetical protein